MIINRMLRSAPRKPSGLHYRAAAALALGCLLSACAASPPDGSGAKPTEQEHLSVYAEFYPLAFAAQNIAGDVLEVVNLTQPGMEPHDLELSGADIADLKAADLILYAEHMAAAVDDAVASHASDQAVNVNEFITLRELHTEEVPGQSEADLDHGNGHDHDHGNGHDHDHGNGHDHDHDHGGVDPHFWLDPTMYSDVADGIESALTRLAPEHADEFAANAEDFINRLGELDKEIAAELAHCEQERLVTAHAAFGYFADRYGFTQVGISGLYADAEPTAGRMAQIAEFVNEYQITTIYTETLLDAKPAETLARETGAKSAVLDPLEGLSESASGTDYFEVMGSNLETLKLGQECR